MPQFSDAQLRQHALTIFKAALRSSDGGEAVRHSFSVSRGILAAGQVSLSLRDFDRIHCLAVGKAAVPMAQAIHEILGPLLQTRILVTKHGHSQGAPSGFEVIESAHPIPGESGLRASERIAAMLRALGERDLLLVAVSGGASALLPSPSWGIELADKQWTTAALLRAGADIYELNSVRKHLSTLKGGQLARLAYPAAVIGLLLSDVIGDDPAVIGSGLTAPDPSTFRDALAVIAKYQLYSDLPASIRSRLQSEAAEETPKPGNSIFDRVYNVVVGSNQLALKAAAEEANLLGFESLVATSSTQGEARTAGVAHARLLCRNITAGKPRPFCLISGGETTVTVRGGGTGGRNQEFGLAAAPEINGIDNVLILSAGTDGSDGPTDAAGALVNGNTVLRGRELGLEAKEFLDRNDSYHFFDALGDLIRTGPTGTNVMDVQIMLAG